MDSCNRNSFNLYYVLNAYVNWIPSYLNVEHFPRCPHDLWTQQDSKRQRFHLEQLEKVLNKGNLPEMGPPWKLELCPRDEDKLKSPNLDLVSTFSIGSVFRILYIKSSITHDVIASDLRLEQEYINQLQVRNVIVSLIFSVGQLTQCRPLVMNPNTQKTDWLITDREKRNKR